VSAAAALATALAAPPKDGPASGGQIGGAAAPAPAATQKQGFSEGISLVAEPGILKAVRPDGTTAWRMPTYGRTTPSWSRLSDRMIELDNGQIIDVLGGRILAAKQYAPGSHGNAGADHGENGDHGATEQRGAAHWSALQSLGSISHFGVAFENNSVQGLRHAWLFYSANVNDHLGILARRSEGHETFGDAVPILSVEDVDVAYITYALDPSDNLTVFATGRPNDVQTMYAVRYEPGTGWLTPTVVCANAAISGNTDSIASAAADADGNVVLVLQLVGTAEGSSALSMYYDAAAGTWTELPIPFGARSGLMSNPEVVGNRSGMAVYLLYQKYLSDRRITYPQAAYYAHRLDLATRTWSAPQLIPATAQSGALGQKLVVVDDAGEATMLWMKRRVYNLEAATLCASRTDQGVWQAPEELVKVDGDSESLEPWGDIDVNAAGDIIAAFVSGNEVDGQPWGAWTHTVRYRAGVGWGPVEYHLPYSLGEPFFTRTRTRVCFYDADKAVATTMTDVGGTWQLTSLLYDGTSWAAAPLALPSVDEIYMQALSGAQGTAVLVYEPGLTGEGRSTWLRDAP
jgi:hypothetical protein